MLNHPVDRTANTLHLHFIHHFAVKSGRAVCAEVLTEGKVMSAGELR
jgi:hypothetical protein